MMRTFLGHWVMFVGKPHFTVSAVAGGPTYINGPIAVRLKKTVTWSGDGPCENNNRKRRGIVKRGRLVGGEGGM